MRAPAVALCFLVACGGGGGGDDTADFEQIELDPAFAMVTVELGSTAQQTYKVYGVNGGKRSDITSRCGLDLDAAFGTTSGATVTVHARGGKTTVNAACGTLTGQAVLAVKLAGQVVVGPNTPPNAPALFASATAGTDASRAPAIEYPIDKAVSPRNIPSIEFQWTAAGNDLFHVALRSSFAEIDVYTTNVEALMSAPHWESLVGTVAGENLAITVEGLAQAAPATKYASSLTTLVVSNDNIDKTAIYYWASSQGNIMSQTFGDPTPPSLVKGDCTSCHSLSRNGTRIGYSRCVGGDCGQLYAGFMKFVERNRERQQQADPGLVHDVCARRESVSNRRSGARDGRHVERLARAVRSGYRRTGPVEPVGRDRGWHTLGADARLVRGWWQGRVRVDADARPVDRSRWWSHRDDVVRVHRRRAHVWQPHVHRAEPDPAARRDVSELLLPELLAGR
ncbi:MAG TPA: hypothetical protein VK427_05760, partial [Kofleriaceae bacterium]|nr:hypothetical protein [Kofleriaceae bacterium]